MFFHDLFCRILNYRERDKLHINQLADR